MTHINLFERQQRHRKKTVDLLSSLLPIPAAPTTPTAICDFIYYEDKFDQAVVRFVSTISGESRQLQRGVVCLFAGTKVLRLWANHNIGLHEIRSLFRPNAVHGKFGLFSPGG